MIPTKLTELLNRVKDLGNHYQKNIQNIQKIWPILHNELINTGKFNRISLLHPSRNYKGDMVFLTSLNVHKRTMLDFLGCYYSIQLLWFNLSYLDWLDYNLHRKNPQLKIFRQFILKSGLEFRRLTAAYMHNLLSILNDNKSLPHFVLAGVGTRSDQDDIDVGIIDDGTEDRLWLNQVIDRIGVEMIRFATNFHFHLSEHVGTQVYSASIPEYQRLLHDKIGNFIILTEMLGAAYIIGDRNLFELFKHEVTDRYYYKGDINKYHEGYLRGIIGEVNDLLARPIDKDFLHPKFDGLRIIKNLIYAYKTRFGIPYVNPWEILDELKRIHREFRSDFLKLESNLTFLEMFRYIYQQVVVQEEYINISDNHIIENLQNVAVKLYYKDFGPYHAVYQLLDDYKEHVQSCREILPKFLSDLSLHLQKITSFKKFIYKPPNEYGILKKFLKNLDFFRGVNYWDDLFQLLKENSNKGKYIFLDDLCKMDQKEQSEVFEILIDWAGISPDFIFRFCNLLDLRDYFQGCDLLNRFLAQYLAKYANNNLLIANLIYLFRKDSPLFCKILQLCSDENLNNLHELISRKVLRGEISVHQKNLADLLDLMRNCNYYFKRFIKGVISEYPDYMCFIKDPQQLDQESDRQIRHIPFVESIEQKKAVLGHYYDLKFLRVGLEALAGESVYVVNDSFTSFVTLYFQELFEICLQQVVRNQRTAQKVKNCFLVYTCGGNGRKQAFDDDFDLIVVVDCENPADMEIFRAIISVMNTELVKRGTLPHFRFSQHFGEYLCPFDGLKDLLKTEYPEIHIDMSQILECRLLVGNDPFHDKFLKEIVNDIIFFNKDLYINRMIQEIQQRHDSPTAFREECVNIKECKGGLRDIEMVILIYKILYQLTETDPYQLIDRFCLKDKKLRKSWLDLKNALLYLQRFRYIYRLTVAAEDHIYRDKLKFLSEKFYPHLQESSGDYIWIWNQFINYRKDVWNNLQNLIGSLQHS